MSRSAGEGDWGGDLPAPPQTAWRPTSVGDMLPLLRVPTKSGLVAARRLPHLEPLIALLDDAVHEGEVRHVVHLPAQTGKTSCLVSALVYACLLKPGRSHMYLSYSEERSLTVRALVEDLMLQVGLDPRGTQETMRLRGGSTIKFLGQRGGVSGNPCTGLLICDDLVKGFEDAASPVRLEHISEWIQTDVIQRVHSGGSILVVGTRYHALDPSGVLIGQGWPYLRIPAEADSPDDPLGRPIGELLQVPWHNASYWGYKKRSTRTWYPLSQGLPSDEGAVALFAAPTYYTALPATARHVMGLDLARSNPAAARKGDSSVILHAIVADRCLYVRSIIAAQTAQHKFRSFAMTMPRALPPDSPCGFFAGPNELGYADEWQRDGLAALRVLPTQGRPKRTRYEQRMIPLWNEGRILLCQDGKSVEQHRELAKQARQFDGSERTHDDFLDALAGAVEVSGLLPGELDRGSFASMPDLSRVSQGWAGSRGGDFAPSVGGWGGGGGRGA